MKAKKELVLVTYWDYLKHYGREEGRKHWKAHKDSQVVLKGQDTLKEPIKITDATKGASYGYVEDLEPIQKAILGGTERVDIRKTKVDISECGYAMIEFIRTPAWNKYIKPQIQKDAVDFVMKATMTSGEVRDEAIGGYKYAQKILRTINKWVADYTYLVREQEKENASRV